MIFQPIPTETVEYNEKYQVRTEGSKGKYTITIVIDGLNDNLLVLRDQTDIEHTNCTCRGFTMTKVPMCKHIRAYLDVLRDSGVEFRLGG